MGFGAAGKDAYEVWGLEGFSGFEVGGSGCHWLPPLRFLDSVFHKDSSSKIQGCRRRPRPEGPQEPGSLSPFGDFLAQVPGHRV